MKHKRHLLLIVAAALIYFAAGGFSNAVYGDKSYAAYRDSFKRDSTNVCNAIYHWKTTFAPDSAEMAFLHRHNVKRIYIRMFDVEYGKDFTSSFIHVTPEATTKFAHNVPEDVEIVPTVYITLEALRHMEYDTWRYAELIVKRILAMVNYNEIGPIGEIQFDCDWTETTRHIYVTLCKEAKEHLKEHNISLSSTIRLHQLREVPPPVDRVVLMLYNTGGLKNPKTRNSILDMKDAAPYLKGQLRYLLPLDIALPTFGWGVKFRDGEFYKIVTNPEESVAHNEYIRWERPEVKEILRVKALAEKMLGKSDRGNILYHLDYSQLKNYTDDEISQLYSIN